MHKPKTICIEVRSNGATDVTLYVSVEGEDAVYGPLKMSELSSAMENIARGATP